MFMCPRCGRSTHPLDRIVKRTEYRRHADQSRYRVVTLGQMCRDCADAEVGDARPRYVTDQKALWG